MLIDVWRRLTQRLPRQDSETKASKSELSRSQVESSRGSEKKTIDIASQQDMVDKGISSEEGRSGISAAIRAGQAELAYSKLGKWRSRYLQARRNAVQLALSRLDKEGCSDKERQALTQLLEDTEAEAATAALVARSDRQSLQLAGVASFRQSLAMRSRRAQLVGAGPEWQLNSKEKGIRFAKRQGITCPDIYARSAKVEELEFLPGRVIKPASGAGARGVYLLLGDGSAFEPGRNRWLTDGEAVRVALMEDLSSRRVRRDRWMVEELITEDAEGLLPGRDFKFYCFYGEVGLVLEVERSEKTAFCEWDGEGNSISTGKYVGQEFVGCGVSAEQLTLAAELSRKVPAPFIRIDFIRSHASPDGMVFGEFTPRPGNFHRFDLKTDRQLGDQYLAAEARLTNDLLKGKAFSKLFLKNLV